MSLLLGLCLITDYPETPDNIYDPNPVFPVKTIGVVLITINVLPFIFFSYALAIILKHGPLVSMRLGASTPEHQKSEVQKTVAQRRRQGRFQRSSLLVNVEKAVSIGKVEKLQKCTAEHRATAMKKIKEREKKADSRVRQRLLERRSKKKRKKERQIKPWQVEPTDNAKEVNQVKQQLVQKIKTKQRLNKAFKKLDLDNNGVLSKNEFMHMISLLLKKNVRRDVMDCCWQAAWDLRKHGHDDKMDSETVAHWLEME